MMLDQQETEDRVVRALVAVAGRLGDEERAVIVGAESRQAQPDEDDVAGRIAHDHGFTAERLIALRGLARSRDVGLDVVLRAALRGDLADVVRRPAVTGPGVRPGRPSTKDKGDRST